jgi:hypothetical protein
MHSGSQNGETCVHTTTQSIPSASGCRQRLTDVHSPKPGKGAYGIFFSINVYLHNKLLLTASTWACLLVELPAGQYTISPVEIVEWPSSTTRIADWGNLAIQSLTCIRIFLILTPLFKYTETDLNWYCYNELMFAVMVIIYISYTPFPRYRACKNRASGIQYLER